MSLLDTSKTRKPMELVILTRENVLQKFEGTHYSDQFKKIVLELFDMDYAHENKERVWIGLLLASNVMSEENGEVIPYEVCIVQDKAGTFKGLCTNSGRHLGRAMPASECMELWSMLMQEYIERANQQEG